jgi:hypothetical protein
MIHSAGEPERSAIMRPIFEGYNGSICTQCVSMGVGMGYDPNAASEIRECVCIIMVLSIRLMRVHGGRWVIGHEVAVVDGGYINCEAARFSRKTPSRTVSNVVAVADVS